MVLRRPRTSEGDGVPARWVSADLTRSAIESPPDGFLSSALPASSSVFLLSTVWFYTGLGYVGAPVAASISIWISMLMLSTYVLCAKKFEHTWEGFTLESFHYVLPNLKLALPSATMVCLEYWAFEILVFMAGVMPKAEQNTSLIAICVNTEAIAYMITYGLSAAARSGDVVVLVTSYSVHSAQEKKKSGQ